MLIDKLMARLYRAPEPVEDRGDDFEPTEEPEEKDVPKKARKLPVTKAEALAELAQDPGDATQEGNEEDPDEEEPEEEPAEEEPEEKQPPAKKPAKGSGDRIPLKRHEAILARERERREALETQLKGFQGQQQVVQANEQITELENNLAKLQDEYTKAMADGEAAKAVQLMQNIRRHDKAISNLENDAKLAAAEARAVETSRYSIALGRIESAYPELDEDHEDFNKETYAEVLDLVKAYRAGGRTPTEALQKAVKVLLGHDDSKQKAATSVKPRVEAGTQDEVRTARAKSATDKALKATAGSPATATAKAGLNSNGAGARRTAADVIKMSQDEFAKLDDKELARLRGDEVDA